MNPIHHVLPWLAALLLLVGCSQPSEETTSSIAPSASGAPAASATPSPAKDRSAPPGAPDSPPPAMTDPHSRTTAVATLGAGCFWCIEAVLERVDGVVDVQSGYMGGTVDQPTYEQVCTGTTGHAEVVQVTFDPARLPYAALLDWFFQAHDPTTWNRQGNDVGTQYRSAIFTTDAAQEAEAKAAKARAQQHHQNPIVTEITPAGTFWPAEAYHQDYFAKNPTQGYCRAMIPPKLKKLGLDGKQPK